jgi:multimeric flavodoxin WrbA
MKIVSILGSPHGFKGSTSKLLDIVLKGAEAQRGQNETIVLKGDSVLPCLGCDACHKKGICTQKDDFESIKNKIADADALVLASPNYIFSVSAQLKAFMDRCCGIIHCLGFKGKYGASVVTSGGGDEEPIAHYMNHFLMTTGIIPVGAVWATMGALYGNEFPVEIKNKAKELGKEIVTSWEKRKLPKDEEMKMNAFYQRMKSLISYRKEEWPYEYNYWKTHHGM